MKTTWKTTFDDTGITLLGWKIESAELECDVCITPGCPDTRDCPGSDPVCEIYDIRVLSAVEIGEHSGRSHKVGDGPIADAIKRYIRRRLLESGWHEQPEVVERCLSQVSEEMKDADEAAREMADESRRGR